MLNRTFDDAIMDAKEVSFDLIFDRLGIKYGTKNWNMIDYLCPFHEHKTGTFHASKWMRQKNACHCFACNEHFDTIEFVKKFRNIGFKESVIWILEQAGRVNDYPCLTGKVEKKPYQLRYLSRKEKEVLGFEQEGTPERRKPFAAKIRQTCIRPKDGSYYEYEPDTDTYLVYEEEKNPWKLFMEDDPVGFRIMILVKIKEAKDKLSWQKEIFKGDQLWEKELAEKETILNRLSKDFGYNRVLQKINSQNKTATV